MSLLPQIVYEVPEETARVAHAAFPKSNPYLRLADQLGVIYQDGDFAQLFPFIGQLQANLPWPLCAWPSPRFCNLPKDSPIAKQRTRCGAALIGNICSVWNSPIRALMLRCYVSFARASSLGKRKNYCLPNSYRSVRKWGGSKHGGGNAPLRRTSWRRCACSIGSNGWARPCGPRSRNQTDNEYGKPVLTFLLH